MFQISENSFMILKRPMIDLSCNFVSYEPPFPFAKIIENNPYFLRFVVNTFDYS